MYALIIALLGLVLVAPAPAAAQVHVDIGINLPTPPRLVVVPQVPAVRYVPAAPGNIFFYDRQYWAFANDAWYVSRGHNGPWIAVSPQFVPRPVLLVPVRYYHVRPGRWQKWGHDHPPRWHDEWGRDWAHKRQWKHHHRDRDDDDDRGRGHVRSRGRDDDDRGKGRGRGRGRDDDDDDRGKDRGRGRGRD
jgi:hypothetical protein